MLVAAARMRVEFEIAPRRRVERDRLVRILGGESGQMRQRRFLRLADVAEQGAGRGDRERHIVDAESGQVARVEKFGDLALRRLRIEMPRRALAQTGQGRDEVRPRHVFADQGFRGSEAREFGGELLRVRRFAEQETAAGEIDPGEAIARFARGDRDEKIVAAFFEQGLVGHRARRDHAHHLALDQTFRRCRVADLLADRDRLAELDQLGKIAFDRMERHAGHRDRRTGGRAALGQSDVEQARGLARVVVEQLVEIAHAEKHQGVWILHLGGEVLAHEWGVLGEIVSIHFFGARLRVFGSGDYCQSPPSRRHRNRISIPVM